MIVRIWEGVAKPGSETDYLGFLETTVLPEITAIAGSLGAQVLRGLDESGRSFIVITYWTDLPAVDAFSAPDRDAAVVPEEAQQMLAEYDLRVRHFDVILDV